MNASRKSRLLVALLVLILSLVAILVYSTARSAKSMQNSLDITPQPIDFLNSTLSEIQIIEKELQGDLDTETRMSLEAKLEILYSQATQQVKSLQQLTASPIIYQTFVPPTFEFDGQRETGIIQYPSVPFPSTEYKITNAWQDLINGKYVLVFVGTLASDPEQGIVIVIEASPRRVRQYLTPTKSGIIRITDAKDSRLVICSELGNEIYYFDVPTQTFVNSIDVVAPTSTATQSQTVPFATSTPPTPYP